MSGINRALRSYRSKNLSESQTSAKSCVFISYQREDQGYAEDIADYIIRRGIDVYIDLEDNDLRIQREEENPEGITNSIKKGLNSSTHMIVILSSDTARSPWIPFEVGYSCEDKGDAIKILPHKNVKRLLPEFLQVKEVLTGWRGLDLFIQEIKNLNSLLYEEGKAFSSKYFHPLQQYLDQ